MMIFLDKSESVILVLNQTTIGMKLFLLTVLSCTLTIVLSDDVRLLDLPPEEAQQHIESKDQSLKYAPKIESNVPAVRFLGNQPQNVVEDIYLANQYHGQDGVGGYLYGYSVPDIAKTEKKKPDGDLRGAYNYVNGGGQEIRVEYWDNGNGFHQIDNVPQILPKQIPDTPEVQAAKDEHARRWQAEAERNSRPVAYPYANAPQPQQPSQLQPSNLNNVDYTGQYSGKDESYVKNPNEWEYKPSEEEKGPPRGFFYNVDYPVGIIVQKQGVPLHKRDTLEDVYNVNRANYEQTLKSGAGLNGPAYPSYQIHA